MRALLLVVGPLAAGVALLAAGGVAESHGRGVRTEGQLRPYAVAHANVVVKSGVTGRVRTRTRGGRTEVRLQARGLAHDATYGARLYNGRCADLGPAFRFAAGGPATRENEVWLDLRTGATGRAGDRIKVRPLPSGRVFSIVVHAQSNADPGARIACADLAPD